MISTRSWSGGLVVLCSPCLDGSVCIVAGQQLVRVPPPANQGGNQQGSEIHPIQSNPIQSPPTKAGRYRKRGKKEKEAEGRAKSLR